MAYTKPQVIAQNNASGSYAAGCPTHNGHNGSNSSGYCTCCECAN